LAHHVHRTAPMGPRVLINGIWLLVGRAELSVHLPPLPYALALAPTAEILSGT
jgi:hypothetical protein